LKPLNVRFSDVVTRDIEDISTYGEFPIAKSLIARAAIRLGLQEIENAHSSMDKCDFVLWLDATQDK